MIKLPLVFAPLFLCILAAATPYDMEIRESEAIEKRQGIPTSLCATELLCCNSVTRADDPATAQILGLLGISAEPYDVIGLTCTPISGLGVYQDTCTAQPVCCWWGAQWGYLVAVDCEPVILGE